MLQAHWILQKNLTNETVLAAIKATLQEDSIRYQEVMLIPFSDEVPQVEPPHHGLVFYGSTTLILNAYRDARFRSGVFFDPQTFTMANYLAQWGESMLNHGSRATTFAALAVEDLPDDMKFFIRPDADTKAFSGQVMRFADIKAFAAQLQSAENPHLGPETPIIIGQPKTIQKEWRSFVVDGQIVDTTRYVQQGELAIDASDLPEALMKFLTQAIARYQPHAVFVIDIAFAEGRYAILECNCFNGTGFYGHDIAKIVRAVSGWIRTH